MTEIELRKEAKAATFLNEYGYTDARIESLVHEYLARLAIEDRVPELILDFRWNCALIRGFIYPWLEPPRIEIAVAPGDWPENILEEILMHELACLKWHLDGRAFEYPHGAERTII